VVYVHHSFSFFQVKVHTAGAKTGKVQRGIVKPDVPQFFIHLFVFVECKRKLAFQNLHPRDVPVLSHPHLGESQLLQEDFPSWLYEVNMGATTIWERWNSVLPDGSISGTGMNSLNHYAYGSIVEWLYRNAAGINPLETSPGFTRFKLTPQPSPRLGSLKASFDSPMGLIKSEWRYTEGKDGNPGLELHFSVPPGAVAELTLPEYTGPGEAQQELGPGEYQYAYIPASALRPKFNPETPISELLADPETKAELQGRYPKLTAIMCFDEMTGERSLSDLAREGFIFL
jgi:alpha-L-rhamnosidase